MENHEDFHIQTNKQGKDYCVKSASSIDWTAAGTTDTSTPPLCRCNRVISMRNGLGRIQVGARLDNQAWIVVVIIDHNELVALGFTIATEEPTSTCRRLSGKNATDLSQAYAHLGAL